MTTQEIDKEYRKFLLELPHFRSTKGWEREEQLQQWQVILRATQPNAVLTESLVQCVGATKSPLGTLRQMRNYIAELGTLYTDHHSGNLGEPIGLPPWMLDRVWGRWVVLCEEVAEQKWNPPRYGQDWRQWVCTTSKTLCSMEGCMRTSRRTEEFDPKSLCFKLQHTPEVEL